VYPSPESSRTLTSGHANRIVTVGGAAVQRRADPSAASGAGAPRAMHKTPRHARRATGAVLPP